MSAVLDAASPPPSVPSGRLPGAVLALTVLLLFAAISHHPSLGPAPRAEILPRLVRLAPIGAWVHAVVIVAELGSLFSLTVLSIRRGFTNHAVTAALIAYCAATGGLIVAAAIDGYLVSAIAVRGARASAQTAEFALFALGICGQAILIATKLATVAASVAVLLWSVTLLRSARLLRAAGVVGVVSACAGAIGVFTPHALDAHNLVVLVLLQGVWYLAIGALMVRGDL